MVQAGGEPRTRSKVKTTQAGIEQPSASDEPGTLRVVASR